MIAKTQEGLIGANNAMNSIRTPMKVFKEARARGDTATMERAMGYVNEINDDAWKHKYSADEGLKQEAEENKLKAEQEREELAQRIEENKDKQEDRIEEGGKEGLQTVTEVKTENAENSEAIADASTDTADGAQPAQTNEAVKADSASSAVVYDSSGRVKAAETEVKFNVTV